MILGIDYGKSYVGLAISEGHQAEGLTMVHRGEVAARIEIFCKTQQIKIIVLGVPEGRLKNEVMEFGKQLEKRLKLPVVYQDETLTSQNATMLLDQTNTSRKKQQTKEHTLAAVFILQSYLDDRKHL